MVLKAFSHQFWLILGCPGGAEIALKLCILTLEFNQEQMDAESFMSDLNHATEMSDGEEDKENKAGNA